jgi:hypothetical protein
MIDIGIRLVWGGLSIYSSQVFEQFDQTAFYFFI